MITRRTFVTHSAAASAALLPVATAAAPQSAPDPLSPVEATRLYLSTDLDYELNLDVSFHLNFRDTPPHITALAAHSAPSGIYRRHAFRSERIDSIDGAFHLYGNRWQGESEVVSRPGGLRDWNDHLYDQDEEVLIHREGLADEIDLLMQFRRLLHLPEELHPASI